jgi:hypothetical protein
LDSTAAQFVNVIKYLSLVIALKQLVRKLLLICSFGKKRFSAAIFSCQTGKFLNNIFSPLPKVRGIAAEFGLMFSVPRRRNSRNKMAPRRRWRISSTVRGFAFWGTRLMDIT